MDDKEILELYWQRNENAIKETTKKYGSYCKTIAMHILENHEDAEECVNDTYWKAWNSIPPQRPNLLATYLGKIVRNLSLDKFRRRQASKRGAGEMEIVLQELGECVSGNDSVEGEIDRKELVRVINNFLDTLSQEWCEIFLYRYWYVMPIAEIAKKFGKTETNVSVILNRLRNKLKKYLLAQGFEM